jgi:predicted MFS family arabinose efflux permease
VSEAPPADDHTVHEAVGPPLSGLEAGVALAMGVNGLLVLGVLPVVLGDLAETGRLTAAGIGQAASVELLTMGIATGAAAILLKAERLKALGLFLCVALALADIACIWSSGLAFVGLRGLAGVVEGVLLWISVSMISRTVTPERWAGVFFTAQVLVQLVLAVACALWIIPRWGANGALVAIALASLATAPAAIFGPSRFAPLPAPPGESGAPPPRGWVALAATLIYVSAGGAVGAYLQPLAEQAGLTAGVARTALWVSLAAQVAGAALATALAGRVRYFTIFLITSAVSLAVWYAFSLEVPWWLFVVANAAAGLTALLLGPFLVPMTIQADPSRRAAVQSGGAQLLGGALGPWLASLLVGDRDVHAVLWLAACLMLLGLAVVAWLHYSSRRV